jgi:hypothetical protein
MKMRETAILAGALTLVAGIPPAQAYELGSPGFVQKPGVVLGAAAAAPPPGLYAFEQVFTYQTHLVGPGAPVDANGAATGVKASVIAQGFVYVPGWTFLGGTYDFAAAVPFVSASAGAPINNNPSGVHNAFFANELSWQFGDSGFFLKAGLGVYAPTGTLEGPAGLGSIGNPWWTVQPNLVFSYLKDGWNLTANVFDEINTANTRTDYRTGDISTPSSRPPRLSASGRWAPLPITWGRSRTIVRVRSMAALSTSTAITSGPPAGWWATTSVP